MANSQELQRYRGMSGYYRQYIDHYSKRMEKLKERIRLKTFAWEYAEETAFRDIKEAYRHVTQSDTTNI